MCGLPDPRSATRSGALAASHEKSLTSSPKACVRRLRSGVDGHADIRDEAHPEIKFRGSTGVAVRMSVSSITSKRKTQDNAVTVT